MNDRTANHSFEHSDAPQEALRPPVLTRRRILQTGAGVVILGGAAAGVDRVTGGDGTFGLTSGPASADAIGPHSPEVLAAERARNKTGRLVTRTLDARPGTVDLAGRQVKTWLFDDSLPTREIRLSAGDDLRVDLTNHLPDPTTVHWHGLALRNDMDGVPGLTMQQVQPRTSFRYQFTAPHPGTYWFHPHVGVQLDTGLIGALVIEDPHEPLVYDHDVTLVLDDWTDGLRASPKAILADQAANGMSSMGSMGSGSMKGMGSGSMGSMGSTGIGVTPEAPLGEDTGDVTYPLHLINGQAPADPHVISAKPGQRIRMRLINAGSDTAYRFAVGGHRLEVVASDGFPVQPVEVDQLILGMGERYDVILTAADGAFPVSSIPVGKQDPEAFAVLRTNTTSRTPALAPAGAASMLTGRTLTYSDLRPTREAALSQGTPDRTLDVTVAMKNGGRQWVINGKTYADHLPLPVSQGERVRLRIGNQSMMFHPMHLHGHTFALVQGGRPGVRKDTLNVLPMQRLDVDLVADNPGQWLLHCHNAYHGELGMMTVLSYVR